jgi:hypothetical protein
MLRTTNNLRKVKLIQQNTAKWLNQVYMIANDHLRIGRAYNRLQTQWTSKEIKSFLKLAFLRFHSSLLVPSLKSVVCPIAPASSSKLALQSSP